MTTRSHFGSSSDLFRARFLKAMQLLKSLTLAALFGSFVFQLQGCGGDDDDTTVGGTTTAPTTAAPAATGNSTRRLEVDFKVRRAAAYFPSDWLTDDRAREHSWLASAIL